eukprot:6767225-Prymnesium_polylepis.1
MLLDLRAPLVDLGVLDPFAKAHRPAPLQHAPPFRRRRQPSRRHVVEDKPHPAKELRQVGLNAISLGLQPGAGTVSGGRTQIDSTNAGQRLTSIMVIPGVDVSTITPAAASSDALVGIVKAAARGDVGLVSGLPACGEVVPP